MKIYVQWATDPVTGWKQYDHTDWPKLPKKPEPKDGERINDRPGWICRLNVQGIIFKMDHIALEQTSDAVKVYCWEDDPGDYEPGQCHGRVYSFRPLFIDPAIGNKWNTNQSVQTYKHERFKEFPKPEESLTRHGIWMPDEMFKENRKHGPRGWRDWIVK